MEEILRIPFVLLVVAVLIVCYLWDQRRRNPIEKQNQNPSNENVGFNDPEGPKIAGQPMINHNKYNKRILIFSLILLLFAIAIFFLYLIEMEKYVHQYFTEPFPNFEGASLLKHRSTLEYMGLALIYGAVLYGFYRFVLKSPSEVSKTAAAVWVVMIVLLTAVGLFRTETKMLVAGITRLETPAGAIEFAREKEDTDVSFSYGDSDSDGAFTESVTDFQAGARRLDEVLDSVESDFEKVFIFCRNDLEVGPYCAPFPGATRAQKENQDGLISAMEITYRFARQIKPIAICLRAYACFYENGVPIQDDLSEIAAGYATTPLSITPRCPSEGSRDPVCDPLERLLSHLKSLTIEGWTKAEKDSCPFFKQCLEATKSGMPRPEGVMSDRDAVVAAEKSDTGFILPYRPMLSAALLTASGYPEEAVGHMERSYAKLRQKFGKTWEGEHEVGYPDFVEALLRLRLLYGLQQVSDHADKQEITLKYQEQERILSVRYLKKNMNVDGEQREKLLEKCVEGISGTPDLSKESKEFKDALHDEELFHFINAKESENREEYKFPQKWNLATSSNASKRWNDYVGRFLWYFVNADFRRLQARAQQKRDKIEDEHLVAAEKWWKVAIKRPDLIKACFSRTPVATPEAYRYLKFQMVYTYGLLHAQKASWLSQKAELARSGLTQSHMMLVDMKEIKDHVCEGYTGLRRAYNTGIALMDDADWKKAVEPQMWHTAGMLRRLVPYMEWLESVEGGCVQ